MGIPDFEEDRQMEHIIAKLLEDFEQGKMSRRQLIQSVALSGVAASAVVGAETLTPVPAAAAPAADAIVLKGLNVDHISFDSKDYTKFRDFYSDLFNMKVFGDNNPKKLGQCHLRCGDTYLTPRNASRTHAAPGTPTGRVQHIAIAIDAFDKKKVEAALKSRGFAAKWTDATGPEGDNVEIHDPEGFTVQIVRKGYEAT
jgi:hypothetical protein